MRAILVITLLYALALQSLLAPVLAATVHRTAMPAGQVICSELATPHAAPAEQPSTHHQDCCEIGCPMRVAGLDAPPLTSAMIAYPSLAVSWQAASHGSASATGPPCPDRAASPQSPRAPPTSVI